MGVTLRRAVLAGALFCLAARVPAQNLLPNAAFDNDLSNWTQAGAGTIEWDPQDADDSPNSGSVKITNTTTHPFNAAGLYSSPCFAITGGVHYSWGGKFLIPSGQADGFGAPNIFTYASSNCSGTALDSGSPHGTTQTGVWESVLNDITVSAGAHSATFAAFINTRSSPAPPLIGYFDDAFLIQGSVTAPCVESDTALCLRSERYRVTARWKSHSDSGDGHAESLTSDTGTFWFFSSNNVELIVKVVGACVNPFNRYWVFAAGLTNVEVTITVVDTRTGEVRTYVNPLDQAFAPIQDTQAFATCP